PLKWANGAVIRNKIQPFDAPFSWYPTDGFTLHLADQAVKIKPQLGVPSFNDHTGTYWYQENPTGSVKVPDTNTKITIVSEPLSGDTMTVQVGAAHK
ncbi:immune inhibitor A domain-containing protein, partial [Streptomyces sp. DT225]